MKIQIIIILFSAVTLSCSPSNPNEAKISKIKASSILNQYSSAQFYPQNLFKVSNFDNNSNPWVEGKDDDGIGEFVEIEFDSIININKFSIINGFNNPAHFYKNNRIKTLIIESDNVKQHITLHNSIELNEYFLTIPIHSNKIKFIIGSVYKGTHYKDTCISLINFFYNKNKINISKLPNYNLCKIESQVDASFSCPPGGYPEFSYRKDGTVFLKYMNVYGFAEKGYNYITGTYKIDISTLKKRKIEFNKFPYDEIKYLWSVKVTNHFNENNNTWSGSGYLIEDYYDNNLIWHDTFCSNSIVKVEP